ncbi:hypothetical protein ACFV8W_40840, partial [Streptomyces sp. NPDC059786]
PRGLFGFLIVTPNSPRAAGGVFSFPRADGGELVARILAADDEGLDLEVPGVKGRKATARRLAYGDIAKARVQVEFNRKNQNADDAENENEEEA